MLPHDLTSYINYFRQLQQEHVALKSFCHGTVGRLIALTRSEIEYPCLWLETPGTRLTENDAGETTLSSYGAFIVLWNEHDLDPAQEDHIWKLTEDITFDIISRIKKDRRHTQFFHARLNMAIEPVATLLVDNDFGWRTEFQLNRAANICYDPNKWNGSAYTPPPAPVAPDALVVDDVHDVLKFKLEE